MKKLLFSSLFLVVGFFLDAKAVFAQELLSGTWKCKDILLVNFDFDNKEKEKNAEKMQEALKKMLVGKMKLRFDISGEYEFTTVNEGNLETSEGTYTYDGIELHLHNSDGDTNKFLVSIENGRLMNMMQSIEGLELMIILERK